MHRCACITLIATLAACSAEAPPATPSAPAPATAPAAAAPPAAVAPPLQGEAAGTLRVDAPAAGAITFAGFGPARFGGTPESLRMAWGGELRTVGQADNPECYFMVPVIARVPAEFNFMIGDGVFARFGTTSTRVTAPGGGMVGMTRDAIARLYPGMQAQPHEYTDGEYLEAADPAGGPARVIFETDGKQGDAMVTEWRVGIPPYVGYVEGCA